MAHIPIASHLVSSRGIYTHHGLYVGKSRVIHYSGFCDGLCSGPVAEVSFEEFCSGQKCWRLYHQDAKYVPSEVITRARSRMSEQDYSLSSNNCEHFVNWCITGRHDSTQVDKVVKLVTPTFGAAAARGGIGVVSAVGLAEGLSGAGIMSGLAYTGSLVGGGAVAGLAILGAAPGLITAAVMNNTILADNPALEKPEREARLAGRVASVVGSVAGTAGGVMAVSAAGTVAGLSATGITSGLAAIGATVGGGMVAGVGVTIAAPVVVAVAGGYGMYKAWRWIVD